MYYWCIFNKPSSELVRQVFDAMSEFPTNHDWISSIKQDLEYLNIDLSETCIQLMSKYEFRKYLKSKIKDKRYDYLKSLQDTHSKTKRLVIDNSPQF